MTLNFKLGPMRACINDDMSRDWVGWSDHVSPQEIYERNRGIWLLGARARREEIATFSVDGVVRVVVAIEEIEEIPSKDPSRRNKHAIRGRVLEPGDADYDALIGKPVDHHRNPVTYVNNLTGPRQCACGCGEPVPGRSAFAIGHDQKAIHARIAKQWGDTLGFIRWFDATYPDPPAEEGRKVA